MADAPARLPFLGTLWRVALAVYVPFTLPLATPVLRECSHCMETWVPFFPVLPGLLPVAATRAWWNVPMQGGGIWDYLPAAVAALLIVLVLTLVARIGRRTRTLTLGVAVIAGTGCAFALASAFRA